MLITDAAVREAAANLAQSLGGDWAIDATAPADGAAHLVYSDGRGISFRPIFGGTTVQLWITGSAAPPLPDDATLADHALRETQLTARLAEGHRYNKATTLVTEADEDPELIIRRTLEDDLLPAFDYKPRYVGHRPWKDLFDKALSQVMEEAPPATGTSLRDCGPEAHTTPPDVGEDAEPTTDTESGPVVDNDPAIEPDPTPAPDGDQQADTPAADEVQEEGPSSVEEPDPEAAQPPSSEPESDSASAPRPSGESGSEADAQPAAETSPSTKRRPRNRTSKRRPKASST
ncbi:dihydrolipoyllysine-residue succinyltransferase component of 2-oxoglutarate dehydrogenase complex [Streptomyces akebiae]|uniref:Uncharacterized protein n=1 Tax=Streptomyces akebiae TaxID=2865673 RepID=A0ABX8XXN7_9ACTN|nr:hypothetical protein [Streptomyces akebiae]QYX80299.1 hypothetical protein K1J60_30575 [Streptomyces akebiae]